MKRPDYAGIAVVILALGVTIGVVTAIVSAALNPNRFVTTEEGTIIAGVLGAMIGSLATYLGGRHNGKDESG